MLRLTQEIILQTNKAKTITDKLKVSIDKICNFMHWPIGHVYLLDNNCQILKSTDIWHLSDVNKFLTFKQLTEKTDFKKGINIMANKRFLFFIFIIY